MIVRCVNDDAKNHIREAVRCYEAGAYRAAIVSAYVAVCFDLIAKLQGLASGGDQEAAAIVSNLKKYRDQQRDGSQQAVKSLLEIERSLLENFRDKFEFFGHQEFEELSRLRADRNRCAHPTFFNDEMPYSPAAELARLHIRSALVYVLTQPARQGKAALTSLKSVVLSSYFPSQLKDAITRLRGTELVNARDKLVKAFIDDLVFGWPDAANDYYQKDNVLLAVEATADMHKVIAVPRLATAIVKLCNSGEANAVRFAAAVALRIPDAHEHIDEATRVVLQTWLTRLGTEEKGLAIKQALRVDWWRDSAIDAIETLTPEQLAVVQDPPAEMITRAAHLYGSAASWNQANKLASSVANPLADRFTINDISIVFDALHAGADLIGSGGFGTFVDLLYDKNPIDNVLLDSMLDEHNLQSYKRSA